jgi:hypothetical protein
MALSSSLLGLRALQATRRLHLPTYVATRFLLESVAGSADSSWAGTVLPRKYQARRTGRFYPIQKFKKVKEDGSPEYRDFFVPSPTTAITEALVLANMATSRAFMKPSNVYSYWWPNRQDCPYNFEHYVNGYKARNDAIKHYLEKNRDAVLIVSDIEKFYPNILRNRVTVRFNTMLRESAIAKDVQTTAYSLLEHLFAGVPGGRGVATGPELSHVIGDLALGRVDEALAGRYGDAYFRYVDDIVLAVPPSEKESAIMLLTDLVANEELTIHRDKTDVVSSDEWLEHGPHHAHRVEEYSFEALVFLLKVYLLRNPGAESALAERLKANGFAFPLERISWAGRRGSFVGRLSRLRRRGWWVAIRALVARERDVLEKAQAVRKQVRESLDRLLAANVPQGSTRRRWFVQRLRYLTNRAFYLMPANDLKFLVDPLSQWPEFVETVALLRMLLEGDVNEILTMPGPALLAGAGFLKQAGRKLPDIVQVPNPSQSTVDALAILLLFDVSRVDAAVIDTFGSDDKELLKFCAGQVPTSRVRDDFSYIDEIRCLQLPRTAQDNVSMIESRFSDQEGVVLDALDIGGEYSY